MPIYRTVNCEYIVHARQGSTDQATGSFLPEVLTFQRYYRKLLGERLSDSAGRIFLRRNYKNLLGDYIRLNRNARQAMSRENSFREAIRAEAASVWPLRYGEIYATIPLFPKRIERHIKQLVRSANLKCLF